MLDKIKEIWNLTKEVWKESEKKAIDFMGGPGYLYLVWPRLTLTKNSLFSNLTSGEEFNRKEKNFYQYYENFDLTLLNAISSYMLFLGEKLLDNLKILKKSVSQAQNGYIGPVSLDETKEEINLYLAIRELTYLLKKYELNTNKLIQVVKEIKKQGISSVKLQDLDIYYNEQNLNFIFKDLNDIFTYLNNIYPNLGINENNLVGPNFGPAGAYIRSKSNILAEEISYIRDILIEFLDKFFCGPREKILDEIIHKDLVYDREELSEINIIGVNQHVLDWLEKFLDFWDEEKISKVKQIKIDVQIAYYVDKLGLSIDTVLNSSLKDIKFFQLLDKSYLKEYFEKNKDHPKIVELLFLLDKKQFLINSINKEFSLPVNEFIDFLNLDLPKKTLSDLVESLNIFSGILNLIEKDKLENLLKELDLRKIIFLTDLYGKEIFSLDTELIKKIYDNRSLIDIEDLDNILLDLTKLDDLIRQKKLLQEKKYLKSILPNYLFSKLEEINTLKDLNKFKRQYEDYISLFKENTVLKKLFDAIYEKRPKEIKNKKLFDIVKFIANKKYSFGEINFLIQLISQTNVVIKDDFFKNFETILSSLIKSRSFIKLEEINSKTSLSELYENLNEDKIKEEVADIFPKSVVDFVLEYKKTDKFNHLVRIGKLLGNLENISEDQILSLIIDFDSNDLDLLKYLLEILRVNFNLDLSSDIVNFIISNFNQKKNLIEKFVNEYLSFKLNENNQEKSFIISLLMDVFYEEVSIDIFKNMIFISQQDYNENDEKDLAYKGLTKLTGWNGKRLLAALQRLGFEIKRVNGKQAGKGDHKLLYRPSDNKYILIPMHNEIKPTTLRGILKKAGILEEFINSLN